jgi:hypothetical protein
VIYLLLGIVNLTAIVMFGHKFTDVEREIVSAIIVFVALIAGDYWRRSTISPEHEKSELKKSINSIGALYIISLGITNFMDVSVYGDAMTAVIIGAAGPLLLPIARKKAINVLTAFWGKE